MRSRYDRIIVAAEKVPVAGTMAFTFSLLAMTRRRLFRDLLIAWMLFQCAAVGGARQQPSKATLQGVVRDAATNEPITEARVTLSPQISSTPPQPELTVDTDGNGEFTLEWEVAAFGGYRFNVAKNGYARHEATLYLSPGQIKNGMVVQMPRTGSISGHISTTTGQPVAGIDVQIQRRKYSEDGTMAFSTATITKTNELGDYRAYSVTPGRYYVSTRPPLTGIGNAADAFSFDFSVRQGLNAVQENYPQTFFPGVSDVSKAVIVELAQGGEVRGIDFTMPPQNRLFSVRGRVVDSSTGQAPANATITLWSSGNWSSAVNWYEKATRTFEIRNLTPGRYFIVARPGDMDSLPDEPAAGEPMGSMLVNVVDSDIDNVVLSISPPPVITGTLRIESQLPDKVSLDNVRVSLVDVSSANPPVMRAPSVAVSANGTFKMNAPLDGEFQIRVSGFDYIKDVRFNNVSIFDAPVRMSTSGTLDILASTNTGMINGTVLNEQLQPVSGAVVVAIPNKLRERTELFKRFGIETGSTGYFVVGGLVPGDYKLFAWQGLEPNSFYDPDVLKKYEEQGTPFRVAEGARVTLGVRVIPAETTP
jgi:hypothetical protein